MKTGRPPVPTNLKTLRGNPGKRPVNRDEPRPNPMDGLTEEFMGQLGDSAAAIAKRLGPELIELGLLTSIDSDAFMAYCQAKALYDRATGELEGAPLMCTSTNKQGFEYEFVNPLLKIQDMALKQMKAYGALFGMDPSSRTRLKTPEAPKEDEFENFLGRGGLHSVGKEKK